MAKQSAMYSSMPSNLPAQKRLARAARMGRTAPSSPNIGDAFLAASAPIAYKNYFDAHTATNDFFRVLSETWTARKDWR